MARALTKAAVVGAAAAAAMAAPVAAFAAGTGSGGSTAVPGPSGVPGGYQTVVASEQIGSGQTVIDQQIPGTSYTVNVTVPASDTSLVNDYVTVTAGTASSVTVSGDTGVVAVGVDFTTDDTLATKVTGTFTEPVQMEITGPFPSGATAVYWDVDSTSWVAVPSGASTTTPAQGATVTTAAASMTLTQDPDIAVVVPAGSTTAVGAATAAAGGTGAVGNVAGATDVSTGKPFLLEGVLAVMLVGVGGTLAWRFKRLRSLRRG